MSTAADYEASYRALAVCLAARVPVILWGPPGQGKTSVIRAIAAYQERHLEILLASIREPQDFAGLPVIADGAARLVAPDWAQRLSNVQDGILFTDEVNTAPPSVQAALLRVSLDKVAGDCDLGQDTSVVAAANPPEQAADGWDLAPPLANRFCHLPWELPTEIVRDGFTGRWPNYEVPLPKPDEVESAHTRERVRVAGFLAARPDLTTVIPSTAAEQGRAFPTPRSWDMTATLSAWVDATRQGEGVRRLLVRGCIGPGASAEYLTYRDNLDLPDPEEVLANADRFVMPSRADQLYVLGAGVLAVVRSNLTGERWDAAGRVFERVANSGHPDIAVAFARDWIRERPEGRMPREEVLRSLVPLLKEARLI
jgi:MoxR-like ATPase